ncbi:MAG: glycosyltransferase [Alphaproteobacteria bacterium]
MAGGIEFSSSCIMNAMIERGHNVSLITWDEADPEPFFALSPLVNWTCLDLGNPHEKATLHMKVKRFLKLRRLIKESGADVVCAFHDSCYSAAILASVGLGVPVIAAERSALSRYDHKIGGTGRLKLFVVLALAARITVFFERYRHDYPSFLRDRITPIPNMVFMPDRLSEHGEKENIVLYVGRLSYEKNPHVMLKAFARLPEEGEWRLKIAGGGPEDGNLKELAKSLCIEGRVEFLGPVKDVGALYDDASVFCFPSRWEGFGNALAEAMAHGLACVGFAETSGARDLIVHEKTGLLAAGNDNVDGLYGALKQLIDSRELRVRLGEGASQQARHFSPDNVFDAWECVFKDVAL